MSLKDMFSRRSASAAPTGADGDLSPVGNAMSVNDDARKKQQMLLAGVAGIVLLGGSYYIFSGDSQPKGLATAADKDIRVSTNDMVNRNMSEQEWMARSENRFQSTDNRLRAVDGQAAQIANLHRSSTGSGGRTPRWRVTASGCCRRIRPRMSS